MNVYAWVLLAAAAAAALADWFAVATRRRAVEQVAKPAYVILLAAFAWLLHADQAVSGVFLLAALGFCLVGDLLLLSDSDRAFGLGLVAFLLAHLAFIAAVVGMPRADPIWPGVAAAVVVVLLLVALVFWPMARRDLAEGLPPTIYALVLGAFVTVAWWSGHELVGIGASLFFVSDGVLAVQRFWREVWGGGVVVMVTYHAALLLVVLGVLRPDLLGV
ncbi:MAG TPA: lysoplasmalogenase [Lapillicoccus sp.]|nr:lysoplasmalogenase [Lapillicoccus sp.]